MPLSRWQDHGSTARACGHRQGGPWWPPDPPLWLLGGLAGSGPSVRPLTRVETTARISPRAVLLPGKSSCVGCTETGVRSAENMEEEGTRAGRRGARVRGHIHFPFLA